MATESLLIFSVLFGPWVFGSTQTWSIWVMNAVGFALGAIWLSRVFRRGWNFLQQAESDSAEGSSAAQSSSEPGFRRILLILNGVLLLYLFVDAINARAVYHLWHLTYRPSIAWLPHSYDEQRSWDFFWKYVALTGYFWAVRDWLMQTRTRQSRLPGRLQRLLWVMSINGLLLALVGLVQRVTGENKLLWLVEPEINKTVGTQFGPFAYRGNGAQYFNLLWPVILAFWLYLRKTSRSEGGAFWMRHRGKLLLGTVMVMTICPFVSLSRTGAVVLIINMMFAGTIVWFTLRKSWRWGWVWIFLSVLVVLGLGAMLEWDQLVTRFGLLEAGYEDRLSLFIPEWQMALDNQPFGAGAGTFSSLYQFYRPSFESAWWGQAHNDWLEALITVGWVGLIISLLPFMVILSRCFWSGGIKVRFSIIALIWVALGGCLVHAVVDFPFQIESILVLFTILCSILSVFSKR